MWEIFHDNTWQGTIKLQEVVFTGVQLSEQGFPPHMLTSGALRQLRVNVTDQALGQVLEYIVEVNPELQELAISAQSDDIYQRVENIVGV